MNHRLKTHPQPYQAIVEGVKRFEFRADDRPFAVNDTLTLCEYEPEAGEFTGEETVVTVDYVLRGRFGVPDGFVVMSIRSEDEVDDWSPALALSLSDVLPLTSTVNEQGSARVRCAEDVLDRYRRATRPPAQPEPRAAGTGELERTAAQERAAVVAMLAANADHIAGIDSGNPHGRYAMAARLIRSCIYDIEAGRHIPPTTESAHDDGKAGT